AVTVRDRDGVVGVGEAAPLQAYDGVGLAAVRAQVEGCADVLGAGDDQPLAALRAACRGRCPLPQARAALDVALWALEARRRDLPLASVVAQRPAEAGVVDATNGATDPEAAARASAGAAGPGCRGAAGQVGTGDHAARV